MKLINKIFGWLLGIGKDRYMHISLGAFIASLFLSAFCWLPIWASVFISFLVVLASTLIKDLVIDDKPDWVDIVCTIIGGLFVWLPVIIVSL